RRPGHARDHVPVGPRGRARDPQVCHHGEAQALAFDWSCSAHPKRCGQSKPMVTPKRQAAPSIRGHVRAMLFALAATALALASFVFGPAVAVAEAAPMASFTVSENPTVGVPVVFDASTSTGAITSYKWEFEPGQKGEGKTVAHTYE